MNRNFSSIWFSDNIWLLAVDCSPSPSGDTILPHFQGEIDTSDFTPKSLNDVEYLIIALSLFEPSGYGDYTSWINSSLKFIKESNFFPNLKSAYVL